MLFSSVHQYKCTNVSNKYKYLQAHMFSRRADMLTKNRKYEEALSCHRKAAGKNKTCTTFFLKGNKISAFLVVWLVDTLEGGVFSQVQCIGVHVIDHWKGMDVSQCALWMVFPSDVDPKYHLYSDCVAVFSFPSPSTETSRLGKIITGTSCLQRSILECNIIHNSSQYI